MESESSSVHLDCNGLETTNVASNNSTLSQTDDTSSKGSVRNACRLCLVEQNELQMDIFKRTVDENNVETQSIAERLEDLLHIKFENKSPLPQSICNHCLLLVDAFTEFREQVLKCENELQQRFNELHTKYENNALIPGLNDAPGEFIVDSDSEIVEVNVEQDYESSEDEFSMESDTETEQNAQEKEQASVVVNHAEKDMPNLSQAVNHNSMLPQALENAVTKTLSYLCQYCDMAFTTQPQCHDHEMQGHDQLFPYTCNFCQARHTNRQTIIAHIRQTHQPDRPYICPLCAKGFCRRSDLKKHTIVHTGVRPYNCTICGKSFSRNTNLTKHLRIHNSTRPHVCLTCPRSFETAQELAQHVVSHSEPKSYQCDQCPASYTRRDKLNIHKATHSRQDAVQQYQQLAQLNSNFEADTEMAYQQNQSILAAHLYQQQSQQQQQQQPQQRIVATKSRSFICDICNRTFTRDQDLQRHRALHLDTLFKCNFCDTGFARKEKLMRHIQENHTPIYNCDICNISFTHAESLNMHMKVHQLQQFATYSAQTALNVVNNNLIANNVNPTNEVLPPQQLTPEEMSFYSQMVPTMNLGFYSETRPEA